VVSEVITDRIAGAPHEWAGARAGLSNGQTEQSIPALEVRPRARAERDLELVAQEQVLKHKVVALLEEGGQGGEEEAE
jgi:hypothetical protein